MRKYNKLIVTYICIAILLSVPACTYEGTPTARWKEDETIVPESPLKDVYVVNPEGEPGMYTVPDDIPAGQYKITLNGTEDAYVYIIDKNEDKILKITMSENTNDINVSSKKVYSILNKSVFTLETGDEIYAQYGSVEFEEV